MLALKTRNLPISDWERVLPDALHSVRSILCASTNCSPHERLFNFQQRSTSGQSLPSWLMSPGPVLIRRNVRQSKYEPLVDEVNLLEANTHYAHVQFPDGRETTVSTKQLSPAGSNEVNQLEPTQLEANSPNQLINSNDYPINRISNVDEII